MKKMILSLFALTAAVCAAAQSAPALLIGTDPASYARGGASLALGANAFAADNGAAAMSLSDDSFDLAFSYGIWAPGTVSDNLIGLGTFFKATDRLSVGLTGRLLLEQPYDVTDANGRVTGSFTPNELVAGLGLSYAVADGFSIGVTARMISSAVAEGAKGSAFGADLTAMYAGDAFSAALGVCNLGSPLSYGGSSYPLPMLARAGLAYSAYGFTASAEADYLFSGALMAGVGLEYCIADIFSLRGGFHYGDQARALPTYASLGFGLHLAGLHLDFAYLTASEALGNSLMFGLGYAF